MPGTLKIPWGSEGVVEKVPQSKVVPQSEFEIRTPLPQGLEVATIPG